MAKELKQLIVQELARRYREMDRCVVVNLTGISAGAASEIRNTLRGSHITLQVVKNSLVARAFRNVGLEALVGLLDGPCALATGGDDVIALAKAITREADRNRSFVIRGGYGEGQLFTSDDVRRLAVIPPRTQLVANFLGALQAPLRTWVGTLSQLAGRFVSVLDAVARKGMEQ